VPARNMLALRVVDTTPATQYARSSVEPQRRTERASAAYDLEQVHERFLFCVVSLPRRAPLKGL
jgi:hypothetical protein